MPAGRPTDYNTDIADKICEKLSDGESLKAICEPEEMPTRSTIYRWLSLHEEFSDMYTRAREEQAETLADEIIAIADEKTTDWLMDKEGNERPNNEAIQRSRLRVDARKWVAAKLKPRKYGDRVMNEHTGKDGGPIEKRVITAEMDSEKASELYKTMIDGK